MRKRPNLLISVVESFAMTGLVGSVDVQELEVAKVVVLKSVVLKAVVHEAVVHKVVVHSRCPQVVVLVMMSYAWIRQAGIRNSDLTGGTKMYIAKISPTRSPLAIGYNEE